MEDNFKNLKYFGDLKYRLHVIGNELGSMPAIWKRFQKFGETLRHHHSTRRKHKKNIKPLWVHVCITIALILTVLTQGTIMNLFYLFFYSESVFAYMWFVADVATAIAFFAALLVAHRYLRRKYAHVTHSILLSEKEEDTSKKGWHPGVLPLGYLTWLFYSAVVVLKICAMITLNIIFNLQYTEYFNPTLMQIAVGMSGLVYSLLVESHVFAPRGTIHYLYVVYLSADVAVELLDSANLLYFLYTYKSYWWLGDVDTKLRAPIMFVCAMTYLLPAVLLYQLTMTNFQSNILDGPLSTLYDVLHLFLLDCPNIAIRIYLWAYNDYYTSIYLMRNVFVAYTIIRRIIPDLRDTLIVFYHVVRNPTYDHRSSFLNSLRMKLEDGNDSPSDDEDPEPSSSMSKPRGSSPLESVVTETGRKRSESHSRKAGQSLDLEEKEKSKSRSRTRGTKVRTRAKAKRTAQAQGAIRVKRRRKTVGRTTTEAEAEAEAEAETETETAGGDVPVGNSKTLSSWRSHGEIHEKGDLEDEGIVSRSPEDVNTHSTKKDVMGRTPEDSYPKALLANPKNVVGRTRSRTLEDSSSKIRSASPKDLMGRICSRTLEVSSKAVLANPKDGMGRTRSKTPEGSSPIPSSMNPQDIMDRKFSRIPEESHPKSLSESPKDDMGRICSKTPEDSSPKPNSMNPQDVMGRTCSKTPEDSSKAVLANPKDDMDRTRLRSPENSSSKVCTTSSKDDMGRTCSRTLEDSSSSFPEDSERSSRDEPAKVETSPENDLTQYPSRMVETV